MNKRLRIERLEATQSIAARHHETPVYLKVYFKHLENERRGQAREPLIPLTPEEERWERETDNDPEFRAYMERISNQRKERLWRDET
jgi:hypothetical protein